ncbi:MAG: hypothetical protein ACI8W8_004863 [Rhodothermales bacterium]|jgi:hypothetical protein
MKKILSIFALFLAFSLVAGELERSEYRGKKMREVEVSRQNNPYILASFLGAEDGEILFKIKQYDRVEIFSKAIYEKIVVIRQRDDPNDPGIRELIPDEVIQGSPELRVEKKDLGPIANTTFAFNEQRLVTDAHGILEDQGEWVLKQFEDLKTKSIPILFTNPERGSAEFELTRSEFNSKLGISYTYTAPSHPRGLRSKADWDKQTYEAGDTAVLNVTIGNASKSGSIYRLLARSMSRWEWLDGKMFYFGDVDSGERRTFKRTFQIPRDVHSGTYYQRIGFNDISGEKPQLSVTLVIRNPPPKSTKTEQ